MSSPLKFFHQREVAETTQRFLAERTIKTFLRERGGLDEKGEQINGFDLFVLHDDEYEEAQQLISFELGSSWGT